MGKIFIGLNIALGLGLILGIWFASNAHHFGWGFMPFIYLVFYIGPAFAVVYVLVGAKAFWYKRNFDKRNQKD